MNTIAPNLTALVGELVGARLIAHGGSLMNLAKQPGSTVQILGAEKALFRALKTKHATPKYGLIYHASLIGQAAPKNKGKISRSLAAKTALAVRCDALGDGHDNSMGLENQAKLEARLRKLEGKELGRSAGSAKAKPKIEVYDKDRKKGAGGLINAAKTYNPSVDSVLVQTLNAAAGNEEEKVTKKKKAEEAAEEALATVEDKKEKKKKEKKKEKKEKKKADEGDNGNDHAEPEHEEKEKKKKEKKEKKKKKEKKMKKAGEAETAIPINGDNHAEPEGEEVVTKEKTKKRKHSAEVQNGDEIVDAGERKKKKRKHAEQEEESEVPSKKEKKKKKKSED